MKSLRLWRPHIEIFIFAVSLQVSVSLSFAGIATRITASHLVLPYFLVAAGLAFLGGRRFRITIGWWWVAIFFAVVLLLMLHGLYVGTQHTGALSGWGVRRVASTVLMLGYFIAGVYLASYEPRRRDDFVLFFVAVACGIAFAAYVAYFAIYTGVIENSILLHSYHVRLQGLMDNPVLFSWLLLSALAFQFAFQERLQTCYPRLNIAGFSILIAAFVVVGAKAAWVGAAVMAAILYATLRPRPAFGPLAVAIVIALVLIALVVIVPTVTFPAKGIMGQSFLSRMVTHDMSLPTSVDVREAQFRLALDLIREHPLWGVGLGGYTWEEARRGLVVQHYLHNSLLWLWTELGPLAVAVFLAFFFRVVKALWPKRTEHRDQPFARAVFALLWAFAAISLVDNVLYQRYLWIFVGAALAVSNPKGDGIHKQDDRNREEQGG